MKPKKVWVFVANETKRKAYELIAREKKFDLVMKAAGRDPGLKTRMDLVEKMAEQLIKNAYSLPRILSENEELASLKEAEAFLAKEMGCDVAVVSEEDSKHERAKNAMPNKPSLAFE